MKFTALPLLAFCAAAFLSPATAQAEDILTIIEREAETPTRIAPVTIPYSYTLALSMKGTDGDKVSDVQAVLRIDPNQPPGARAQVMSSNDPENEVFQEFLAELENPEKEMAEKAKSFWCGTLNNKSPLSPSDIQIISETDTEAVIIPRAEKLAELLMQSEEDEDPGKQERKLKKKLTERIKGQMTLSKPTGDITGFSATMTRPIKMMVVAKMKTMTAQQSCTLAPNGFYHLSNMQMEVSGKALGKAFGQEMSFQVTDLKPVP